MSERTVQIKNREEPASYKQVAYLGRLMTEAMFGRELTKGQASDLIEGLKGENEDAVRVQLADLLRPEGG